MKIAVLNGPNLNLLGQREPELYGTTTLVDIEQQMQTLAEGLRVELTFGQYNEEEIGDGAPSGRSCRWRDSQCWQPARTPPSH